MRITEEQDKQLSNQLLNSLLTMINMLDDDQKAFIKANIHFADGKDFPLAYYKLIDGSTWTRAELRKQYGTYWAHKADTGENRRLIKDIEPLPPGYETGFYTDNYIGE